MVNNKNSHCLTCHNLLRKSKLNNNVWVCKGCNTLYDDDEINPKRTLKNYNLKTGRFENAHTKRSE